VTIVVVVMGGVMTATVGRVGTTVGLAPRFVAMTGRLVPAVTIATATVGSVAMVTGLPSAVTTEATGATGASA
jgi:hypothetical protein